jgi:hypothetical protein
LPEFQSIFSPLGVMPQSGKGVSHAKTNFYNGYAVRLLADGRGVYIPEKS